MDDPWPFRRHAPLTERWWWVAWDPATATRQRLLTHLDGAAIALEEIICGRPAPEAIVFVQLDPPRVQATSPEHVADEVRAAIDGGFVPDARLTALVWLFKYAYVCTARPMNRLYPARRERSRAIHRLRTLRPPLSAVLPLEAAREAHAVLETVKPIALGLA